MEQCEIYNSRREKTGKTVFRGAPLQEGEFLLVAGVWVFDGTERILLTRRASAKRYAPGKWENTGGHVRADETGRQAAARELFEETGIQAAPEELTLFGLSCAPPYIGEEYYLRRHVPLSAIRLQEGETSEAKYVSPAEFDRMIAEGEMAGSTAEHLAPIRADFDRALRREPVSIADPSP